MAYTYAFSLVEETTTTPGLSDYVLAGAVTHRRAFGSVYALGDRFPYIAVDTVNGGFECGIGTYIDSTNTVTRDLIAESSNSDLKVNWPAGTRFIYVGLHARAGNLTTQLHIPEGTAAPTVFDDSSVMVNLLSFWLDKTNKRLYSCMDPAAGAASWRELLSSDPSNVKSGLTSVALGLKANAAIDGAFILGATRSGGTSGQHQTGSVPLALQTTTATTTRLQAGGSNTQRLVIPSSGAWNVTCRVIGYDYTNHVVSRWDLGGLYRRNGAGAPNLVGSVTGTTATAQDAGAAAWTATLAIDAGNNAIDVNVTGAAATTINWAAAFLIEQATG